MSESMGGLSKCLDSYSTEEKIFAGVFLKGEDFEVRAVPFETSKLSVLPIQPEVGKHVKKLNGWVTDYKHGYDVWRRA